MSLAQRRSEDAQAHSAALAQSPYADDARVAAATHAALAIVPDGLLQVHRLAVDKHDHVIALLSHMDAPMGAFVLDVGCGTGECAALMSKFRPDLRITLLNVSAAQLKMCPPGFDRIHSDMHEVLCPDAFFDVVMFCYSLGHGLLEKVMPEAARLLRPGGILFIFDLASDTGRGLAHLSYRAHTPDRIEEEAQLAGFALDRKERWNSLDTVLAPPDAKTFNGAKPILYRFTKGK